MFASVFKSIIIASVVASLATARNVRSSSSSQCDNGGELSCCNHLVNSTTAQSQDLGGLLGLLSLGNLVGDIGIQCSPINVLGIGNGGDCVKQAVCCNDVTQSGLINLGCSPINLSL